MLPLGDEDNPSGNDCSQLNITVKYYGIIKQQLYENEKKNIYQSQKKIPWTKSQLYVNVNKVPPPLLPRRLHTRSKSFLDKIAPLNPDEIPLLCKSWQNPLCLLRKTKFNLHACVIGVCFFFNKCLGKKGICRQLS